MSSGEYLYLQPDGTNMHQMNGIVHIEYPINVIIWFMYKGFATCRIVIELELQVAR